MLKENLKNWVNAYRELPVDEQRKWRFVFYILPLTLVINAHYLIQYNFLFHIYRYNHILLSLFAMSISAILVAFFTKNRVLTTLIFLVSASLSLIFLLWTAGATKAPGIFWLAGLASFYGMFFGRRGVVVGGIVGLATYIVFYYLELYTIVPNVVLDNNIYDRQRTVNYLIFTFYIGFCFYYYARVYESANEKIIEKGEQVEDLLRIFYHDIANPLSSIISLSSLISKGKVNTEDGLRKIERSSENMRFQLDMVRNLMTLKDGKFRFEIQDFLVKDLIQNSIELFADKTNEKAIHIRLIVENENMLLKTDSIVFINQIMSNLLSNSIKFSPNGSEVIISAHEDNNGVEIRIRDFGVGMSPEIVSQLFVTNKVISKRGTNNELGTGYGLALVNKFVSHLGGSIVVDSVEKTNTTTKHGTTVTLIFPKTGKELEKFYD